MSLRFILLSTLATVLAFPIETASACSPPPPSDSGGTCTPTVTVASLPASAPAIPLSVNGAYPDTYRLLTASGAEVATKYTKDLWQGLATPMLVFDAPPAPGEYQLAYEESCPGGVAASPAAQVKTPITIAPAVPVPASAGTFTVENRSVQNASIATYSGGCTVTMEYVKVDVVFHVSPELEPLRSVTSYLLTIDGQDRGPVPAPLATAPASFPVVSLHAACDGDDRQTGGVTLGTHSVRLTWRVAGASSDLVEASTTVDLSCGPSSGPPELDRGDAGAAAPSSGAKGDAAKESAEEGGCSTTGRGPLSAGMFALLALVALRKGRSFRRR